jgi:hypothetical protein
VKLFELSKLIRSKNAGPFTLTIDVMFDDPVAYAHVRDSGVLTAESVAAIYGIPEDRVSLFAHDAALALKITFPRPVTSGSRGDTDVYGGQFHAPLVELEIGSTPLEPKVLDPKVLAPTARKPSV